MRNWLYSSFIIILILLLCGCSEKIDLPKADPPKTESTQAEPAAPKEEQEPAPAHSALFLPAYSEAQVEEYFKEVALTMEYTEGEGNFSLIQKWRAPLIYRIDGAPTDQDLLVLEGLFEQLNEIEGFPGIIPAKEGDAENLTLSFLSPDAFREGFSEVIHGEEAFGAAQFWFYNDTNEIHTARIGYRTDIDQETRNSVLIEEVVNILGISDTVLREDSITYQYSDANATLSDTDLLILRLLYHKKMECGMNQEQAAAIIKELYY